MCSLPRSHGPRLSQSQLRSLIDGWRAHLEITQSVRTPEDVLHELLHVAHPTWSEAAVVRATTRDWRHRLPNRLHPQPAGVLSLPEVA